MSRLGDAGVLAQFGLRFTAAAGGTLVVHRLARAEKAGRTARDN
ncbi:MAG TPA: hypothetical protein VFB29_16915 [Pseudolabrys sp.]|nr:hypothetical protein [Pseudolabrys sp.]